MTEIQFECTQAELEEELKGIELIDGLCIEDVRPTCGDNLLVHMDDGRKFFLSPAEVLKMVNEFDFTPFKELHLHSLRVRIKEGDYHE